MLTDISGDPSVLAEIDKRLEQNGKITFKEFMEIALYFPGGGYYTSDRERWGKGGDYITNVDVSPLFSRVLTKQVDEMWSLLGKPSSFHLVEVGAREAELSRGVLKTAEELYPDLFNALTVSVVEKNPFLRKNNISKISWYEDITDIPSGIVGCVFSNELIDALPIHLILQQDGIKEVYLHSNKGAFEEIIGKPSTTKIAEYFKELDISLGEGQRTEVNLNALDWIHKVGTLIDRGFLLTIDYGYSAEDYYKQERHNGTLLCHYKHTINENLYEKVGYQDITSHVDFTGLVMAGRNVGLDITGFTTQFYFLLSLGILEELEEISVLDGNSIDSLINNQGIKRLIMPGGMADTFKVLVQHKGVDVKSLTCFSFKDFKEVL